MALWVEWLEDDEYLKEISEVFLLWKSTWPNNGFMDNPGYFELKDICENENIDFYENMPLFFAMARAWIEVSWRGEFGK